MKYYNSSQPRKRLDWNLNKFLNDYLEMVKTRSVLRQATGAANYFHISLEASAVFCGLPVSSVGKYIFYRF
jgi:hypothetical protein